MHIADIIVHIDYARRREETRPPTLLMRYRFNML